MPDKFNSNVKRLLRKMVADRTLTDEMLSRYEFSGAEIEELHNDKNYHALYDNLKNYELKKASDRAVVAVLGDDGGVFNHFLRKRMTV